MHVTDSADEPLFRAYTEVDFSGALGGTRMDVVQTYTFIDPSIAAPMVAGAPGFDLHRVGLQSGRHAPPAAPTVQAAFKEVDLDMPGMSVPAQVPEPDLFWIMIGSRY